jgi:O-antigen biosynthesis protein WbqP
MKRMLDVVVTLVALVVFAIPMIFVALAVRLSSRGPVLYWSDRVGRNNVVFAMPKFRTMGVDTPVLPTHLLQDPAPFLTPIGSFLRKSSLDELPQLWCVLIGDMSLVGPRPALHNQQDLLDARTAAGVHVLLPGLTGWAQVNGRDEVPMEVKVGYDVEYLTKRSFWLDVKILFLTFWKVVMVKDVAH